MTTEQPMTISRVCDRLWFNLTGALKDASEWHPSGELTIHDSPLTNWYAEGLMMAHKIETIAKGEENARHSNTATDNGRAEGKESTADSATGV